MTTGLLVYLCGAAVIVSGLVAGVFVTFSDFVMRSLAAAQPAAGIEAMQQINRKVYRSLFLPVFLGLAPVSIAIAAYVWVAMAGPASAWLAAGAAIYGVGVVLVTMLCNVPMNKRLDVMDPTEAAAGAYWPTYLSTWTRWNHLRAAAATASTICFLVGTVLLSQG